MRAGPVAFHLRSGVHPLVRARPAGRRLGRPEGLRPRGRGQVRALAPAFAPGLPVARDLHRVADHRHLVLVHGPVHRPAHARGPQPRDGAPRHDLGRRAQGHADPDLPRPGHDRRGAQQAGRAPHPDGERRAGERPDLPDARHGAAALRPARARRGRPPRRADELALQPLQLQRVAVHDRHLPEDPQGGLAAGAGARGQGRHGGRRRARPRLDPHHQAGRRRRRLQLPAERPELPGAGHRGRVPAGPLLEPRERGGRGLGARDGFRPRHGQAHGPDDLRDGRGEDLRSGLPRPDRRLQRLLRLRRALPRERRRDRRRVASLPSSAR